jgi:hypothetical protein
MIKSMMLSVNSEGDIRNDELDVTLMCPMAYPPVKSTRIFRACNIQCAWLTMDEVLFLPDGREVSQKRIQVFCHGKIIGFMDEPVKQK